MSSPSFENIDQWFFEYTEGNLSPQQVTQLLEFMERNPELQKELLSWQKSKFVAEKQLVFDTQSLMKPTYMLQKKYIVVLIVGVFLLATLTVLYYPKSIHYSQNALDLEIIHIGDNHSFLTAENFQIKNSQLAQNAIKPIETLSNKNISSDEIMEKLSLNADENNYSNANVNLNFNIDTAPNSIAKTTSTIKTAQNLTTSVNLTANDEELFVLSGKDENPMGGIVNTDGWGNNQYQFSRMQSNWDEKIGKNKNIKANGLEDVIAYLDGKETKGRKNKAYIFNVAKSGFSTEMKKMTFKMAINNSIRSLQRMIDQPLALRNTKRPYYHVPMMVGYAVAPAMVGTAAGNRLQLTSRMQWQQETNSQMMNRIAWDGYSSKIKGGFGVDFNYRNYNYNTVSDYMVRLTYSPKFTINSTTSFEPALSYKMGAITINKTSSNIGSKIEVDRQNLIPFFENETNITGSQLWYKDVGIGFVLNTQHYYFGLNADNLARHDNNYFTSNLSKSYKEAIHFTSVIGTEYQSITRDLVLNGYVLVQNYGDLSEFWAGGNFQLKWFKIGAGINTTFDFGASLGMEFKNFAINYNVDRLKSKLLNKQLLSHQITMEILLKAKNRYTSKFLNL